MRSLHAHPKTGRGSRRIAWNPLKNGDVDSQAEDWAIEDMKTLEDLHSRKRFAVRGGIDRDCRQGDRFSLFTRFPLERGFFSGGVFRGLVLPVLVLFAVIATTRDGTALAQQRTETYPDGAKKTLYSLDKEGQKHGLLRSFYPDGTPRGVARYVHGKLGGPLTSFHPNGKVKVKAAYRDGILHGQYAQRDAEGSLLRSAVYKDGRLHGPYQEFEGGVKVKEQMWVDGQLLFPMSVDIINRRLVMISQTRIETVGQAPSANAEVAAILKDPVAWAKSEEALRLLMAHRFLCGVPYEDLQLDWNYAAHAVAGARILASLGKLTHTPENPGWPDADYQMAKKGCGSSNLSSSNSLTKSVAMFMNDSDKSNIDRLGHRRWCLNPAMQRTGFGTFGKFSAMWSFDGSREEVPDYEYIAFPPAGLMPGKMFSKDHAWSVSPNSSKYRPPEKDSLKVTVTPARLDPQSGTLQLAAAPLSLSYFGVNGPGFSKDACIIFRPEPVSTSQFATYRVVISGLKKTDGSDATIEYTASFF